jgi:hypothetical protein
LKFPFEVEEKSEVPKEQQATTTVQRKGATWLQLVFGSYNLQCKSRLRIRSVRDDDEQIFTQKTLAQSGGKSALFNGDTVQLKLEIAPGEKDVFVKVKNVISGTKAAEGLKPKYGTKQAADTSKKEALCDKPDSRVSSNDKRVGRIEPAGCTGFIVAINGFLTAGHCTRRLMTTIEFNVPRSQPDGTPVRARVADQYTILQNTMQTKDPGDAFGEDWALFAVSPNSNTGKLPVEVQGPGFELFAGKMPSKIRVAGFGVSYIPLELARSHRLTTTKAKRSRLTQDQWILSQSTGGTSDMAEQPRTGIQVVQ